MSGLPKRRVLGVDISIGSFADHLDTIIAMAQARRSAYVCCVNAHMTVEAYKDQAFARIVNEADLATADGMPILRSVQWFHRIRQERVAGNDLLPVLLARAVEGGLSVFLFGGQPATLSAIKVRATKELPGLRIVGSIAPPFRAASELEMDAFAEQINASGAHLVMVSLGCPKQEKWMAAMRGKINAVMLGLGGAFLLYIGADSRAPRWMRDLSLEWAYRLWLEPGRLWKRYLVTNSIFLWLFAKEGLRRLLGLQR